MVNPAEVWESIEKYTQHLECWVKIGSYQLKKFSEGVEIKVRVGKFDYTKNFKEPRGFFEKENSKVMVMQKNKGESL